MNSNLSWDIIIPDSYAPKYIKTVARVYDGKMTREHEFSRDMDIQQIEKQLKLIYKDNLYHKPPKAIVVRKDGVELVTIIEEDGCIISVDHNQVMARTIARKKAQSNRRKLLKALMNKMNKDN